MKIGKKVEAMQPDVIGRVGARTGSGGPAPSVEGVEQNDSVQLSHISRDLQSAGGEPVDVKKVRELAAAIRSGEFQVNAQKVADKMINEAAQLLERIASSGQ